MDALLRDAIKLEMVADVPLGAFLSGGVDSSTVVTLMQAQSARPVKTFTIGFNEAGYNEAVYAKEVARHLGTDHTELYITPEQAMAVIPKLPTLYDEPFSDSSQIPTYLVSELARRHVTVSLSGDGGDELFAGYNRYFLGRGIWNKVGWIPPRLRNKMAQVLTAVSPQAWDRVFNLFPFKTKHRAPGDKLHKLAEIFGAVSPEVMYTGLVSHWKKPTSIVLGASEPPTHLTNRSQWADLSDFTLQMMYLDTVTYLPDDILVKVDRASMGVSLEGRVPFLDPRIVEFAWQVPLSMKVRGGKGKWLLRQVLHQYVPRELIERPKVGFGIPIDTWLRGPLREWGESLLDERRLKIAGFFKAELIRQKWIEHLSGARNWQYHLWDILMFQAWLDESR
ncbi:MAG: asparagine synthase C-terminal domain-containing protein [Candidatus Manganitrophus sp.]|nr:asparagine synthase C-terminal domain-containing protein [Candidatus Manganitrophus sp.]